MLGVYSKQLVHLAWASGRTFTRMVIERDFIVLTHPDAPFQLNRVSDMDWVAGNTDVDDILVAIAEWLLHHGHDHSILNYSIAVVVQQKTQCLLSSPDLASRNTFRGSMLSNASRSP